MWQKKGTPLNEFNTHPRSHFVGGSIMVWSCIGYNGVGLVTRFNENINASLYKEVLEDEMMSSVTRCVDDTGLWYFQQDNAPCHTARSIKTWFQENGISVMEWPTNSPDLNPIGNLWDLVKSKTYKKGPFHNLDSLWDTFCHEWYVLDSSICVPLIESINNRMKEVIKAKGGPTNY